MEGTERALEVDEQGIDSPLNACHYRDSCRYRRHALVDALAAAERSAGDVLNERRLYREALAECARLRGEVGRWSSLVLRRFPMQRGPSIPWTLAEQLYDGWVAMHGREFYGRDEQSLQRIADRGGWSWNEVAYLWENPKVQMFRSAIEMNERLLTAFAQAQSAPLASPL